MKPFTGCRQQKAVSDHPVPSVTLLQAAHTRSFGILTVRQVQTLHLITAILSLFILSFFISAKTYGQTGKTFVVNTLGDAEDPDADDLSDGVCDADTSTPGNQCTFRAAIQNHNANRNLDHNFITFAIPGVPGTGSIVIMVGSTGNGPLPPILGSVTIEALNSDNGSVRRIELNGSQAGSSAMGLKLLGGQCEISFFIINHFASNGIYISGTPIGDGGHVVRSNYIGTDITGTMNEGNGGDGILIDNTPGNTIGGAGTLEGNVILGNAGYGVHILGRDQSETGQPNRGSGNTIIGNRIGENFSENNIVANAQGGVLNENAPNNNIGGSGNGQGNKIVGEKNGITIQGSLSKGVSVQGNFVGRDGTTAKFLAGIFARSGELLTIQGNVITNIGDVGMDIFLDANSTYNVSKNEVDGNVKVGTKFTFGTGRTINVNYQDNMHFKNATGLMIDESVNSTINWLISGDSALNGENGGNIIFRSAGTKQLTNNQWKANSSVGFNYAVDFAPGVKATVTVNGDVYLQNGAEGFKGKIQLQTQAELVFTMAKITGSSNGKDGLSLGLAASAGAKADLKFGGGSDHSLNAGAALRLMGEKSSLDLFRVEVENLRATGNKDVDVTLYFLNINLRHTLLHDTITGNAGAGIVLDGATEAEIDSNLIQNNGTGIVVLDVAKASIVSNTISGNKKGVVLAGTGTGTSISSNAIFNNTQLGIDLGNNGITLNDNGDADTGPNNLQNFPVLTTVNSSGGNTIIEGKLNSGPSTNFVIEFFSNAKCGPSGFGEGQTFLGAKQVTTDATGNATFTVVLNGVSIAGGSSITATATDPNNNTSEFGACLLSNGTLQQADLELTQKTDKTQLTVGGQLNFTITVSNKGPISGTGILVTDKIPVGITIGQVNASTGQYDKNTGVWQVGTLASGAQAVLNIMATADQTGDITNTAEITAADQPDPDSSPGNHDPKEDDQVSVTIQVTAQNGQQADLEITKRADRTQVAVGDQVVFTISLFNRGPATATNIQIRDIVPSSIDLANVKVSAGTYNSTTGIWQLNHLFKGAHAVATFTGNTTQQGTFINTAEVLAADQKDPDSSPGNNNSAEDDQASVVIRSLLTKPADLELTKQADRPIVVAGEKVNFTITLLNKGAETATGILVKELASNGLVFDQVSASSGNYDITSGTWTLNELAAGNSASLSVNATTMMAGTLTNTAEIIASDQPDPDSSPDNGIVSEDDQASVSIKALQTALADLEMSLTSDKLQVMPGDQITLKGILFNRGPSTATNIAVSEMAPAGLTFNNVKISAGSYAASNGTWKINHLFKGAKAYITITATVTQSGDITNTTEVLIADQSDPDSSPGDHVVGEDDQATITIHSSTPIARMGIANTLAKNTEARINIVTKGSADAITLKAYPNPIAASTIISFDLPKPSVVQLVVINEATGNIIARLITNRMIVAGKHDILWLPPYLSSGVYIVQLKTDKVEKTYRIIATGR